MGIGNFSKKPDIRYTPAKVLTLEPVRKADGIVDFSDSVVDTSDTGEVTDIINQLKNEEQKLQEIQDAILSTIPNVDIPVPDEYQDIVGKKTLSTSDYLANLDGTEYGSVVAVETVENHYLAPGNPTPQFLLLPSLHAMSSTVKDSVKVLEGDMFSGFYADPQKKTGLQTEEVSGFLSIPKQDIEASKRLRYESLQAISAVQQAISECLIHNILNSSNGSDSETVKSQMTKKLQALRSMRSILKFYTTAYATDWKSATSYMRTQMSSMVMRNMLYQALAVYSKARNKLITPLSNYYSNMVSKTTCPMWDSFNDMVLNSMLDVGSRGSTIIADIFDYKQGQSQLQIDRLRQPKALMITRKWLPMLDVIIAVMDQVVTGTKSMDALEMSKILSASRAGDKMADASAIMGSSLGEQYQEMGIDPEYPDPKGLAPPGMGNMGPEALSAAARDYYDFRRSTESSESDD